MSTRLREMEALTELKELRLKVKYGQLIYENIRSFFLHIPHLYRMNLILDFISEKFHMKSSIILSVFNFLKGNGT